MIKFLLTSVALIFLFRVLLKLLLGGFVVRVEKHYYHNPDPDKKQKPEGYTTIHQQSPSNKPNKYSDAEGEYVNYEEIK